MMVSTVAWSAMCKLALSAAVVLCLAAPAAAQQGYYTASSGNYDASEAYWWYPGPEITGNYACPYLYDCATDRTYADPAYYNAQNALNRWQRKFGTGQRANSPRYGVSKSRSSAKVVRREY
jgi:hypothetical protein